MLKNAPIRPRSGEKNGRPFLVPPKRIFCKSSDSAELRQGKLKSWRVFRVPGPRAKLVQMMMFDFVIKVCHEIKHHSLAPICHVRFLSRATARSFDRVSEWGDCGEVVSRRVFRVPVPRVGLSTGVQQSGFAIIDGKIDGKIDSSSTAVSHEQRRLFCLKSGVRLLSLGGS